MSISGRSPVGAVALVAAALLLGGGCPRPVLVAVRPHAAPTVAMLAEALAERQRAVRGMNARVRATSWLGGDRVRATVLMLVDRPGRLRFEAEVSLQGTVAVLATDGHQFSFLDTMKNELRQGPACPANVASLIRIPLGPADVAAILLGDARLPADTSLTQGVVDWDPARAADVWAVPRDDGWLRILFHGVAASDLRIIGAIATGADGRPRWRVAFEDFTAGAAGQRMVIPQTIRFAEGEGSFDEGVEIKFKERTLNDPLADEAFTLAPAPNVTTIRVGCPPAPPG